MSAGEIGIIHFKGVTKKFGSLIALDNVSFNVKKGEFVFITGPSGAGKTTILKIILGELVPDAGEVTVDSFNVKTLGSKDLPLFRQKIGTVFQDFKVLPERTVYENVAVALAVIGLPEGDWPERVAHVLKLAGLFRQANHFPSSFPAANFKEFLWRAPLPLIRKFFWLMSRPETLIGKPPII